MTHSPETPNTQLRLTINGEVVQLQNISPSLTLLQYLQQSGRTGTKEGCGDGDCGACTVAIIGEDANGNPCYQAVNSCLIPLGAVAGREVVTVEGLAKDRLHPVQAAMVKTGGSQCGYCTPGFIMSMFAAYYGGKLDDAAVEGNLCRCTGYLPIRRAAQLAISSASGVANETANGDVNESINCSINGSENAATHTASIGLLNESANCASDGVDHESVDLFDSESDPFRQRLTAATADLRSISYSTDQQQFYRPTELNHVLALLQQHPEATLVAGATDLGLEMSHHRRAFPVLISLEAVSDLKQIRRTEAGVEIGAAVPLSQIEANLHGVFPSLDEMLHWFAARQVRNRATIGGNIGTASPIGDLPPVLLALDAEVELVSAQGHRVMPLANFFKGYRQTDLQSGELIRAVHISTQITPSATRRFSQSYKVGKRGTDDISIVAAAFTVDLDAADQIVHARLAYGGVAATPVRAVQVEQMLIGQPWSWTTIQQVKPALQAAFTPLTDLRGTADYRRMLIGNLLEKFFVEINESQCINQAVHY
ncbi:MAG: xanthine dehydrogenase small subunit [Elainella sp. C42_A2020_010]|nr:xanthine dehydrogenase small subunit [Elainella sp. C42_A2020_010]